MGEKIIRDPVHDVIAFRLDRPIDALLFRLINAAEFQRLRRIRQLGMASLAYPGADHSRYSHSLGVMETARRILNQLRQFAKIDPGEELVCVVSSLLHDLGHGPFSHVFERVSGIHHERLTARVIGDKDSDVHRLLSEHDLQLPELVLKFISKQTRTFYTDIVSSQLDADRFDYLLRDNLMTGSQYGGFDLRWLIHALEIDEKTNRLAISYKGVSAAEAYLQSRFHMYRNVYFHKVVRSAEGMVKLALQRAKRLAVQKRLEWPPGDHGIHKALLGQRLSMEEFTDLDDISVLHCFKLWTKSHDTVLAGLCRGLLFRNVFKTIDLAHVHYEQESAAMVAAAEHAVVAAGGEPGYELFYDEPADTPYESFSPDNSAASDINVKMPGGQLTPIVTVSPITQALNRDLMFRRIHVSGNYRDVALKAIGKK
ncbi:HD domain-containing protein [soil metagenome]